MGFVQSAGNKASTSTTVTVTLGSTTITGNCLFAGVGCNNAATASVSGITIGGSADHWAQATSVNVSSTDNLLSAIWSNQGMTVNSTSVVVTVSVSGATLGATVIEWNGVASSGALDKTHTGTSTSGANWSSGSSGVLTNTNEVAIGTTACATGAALTITGPSSPWTNLTQQGSAAGVGELTGYQQVSATTALTYNGTQTNTSFANSASCIATFTLSGSITVNLPLATINTAAFNVSPPIYVNLPVASINTAALNVTPLIAVVVALVLATINTAANNVTPTIVPKIIVNLPVASINTSSHNVSPVISPVPPKLLVSIAAHAGTDPYAGYAYPAGITQFNSQIQFINVLSGIISFMASLSQANAGIIQTLNTPGFMDILSGRVTNTDTESEVFLESRQSGGGTATVAINTDQFQVNAPSNLSGAVVVGGTLQTSGDASVNSANLNVGSGSAANVNLNPKIATPPNLAAVIAQTATLAQTQACLGGIIQSLQNRGLVN